MCSVSSADPNAITDPEHLYPGMQMIPSSLCCRDSCPRNGARNWSTCPFISRLARTLVQQAPECVVGTGYQERECLKNLYMWIQLKSESWYLNYTTAKQLWTPGSLPPLPKLSYLYLWSCQLLESLLTTTFPWRPPHWLCSFHMFLFFFFVFWPCICGHVKQLALNGSSLSNFSLQLSMLHITGIL